MGKLKENDLVMLTRSSRPREDRLCQVLDIVKDKCTFINALDLNTGEYYIAYEAKAARKPKDTDIINYLNRQLKSCMIENYVETV